MKTIIVLAIAALHWGPLSAQWLDHPTPGIPRLSDGKADLAAPAPPTLDGKPDLTDQWLVRLHPGYIVNVAADLQPSDVEPWAASLFVQRIEDVGKDDPSTIGCWPFGPRAITGHPPVARVKIVQTPTLIVFLYEDLSYRQIFLDGRELPKDPYPSFMGYSVGRWEGDVLVVESVGFKDGTWLDFGGHPHTEALRTTERYRRIDFGHIERQVRMEDRGTFRKPITIDAEMVFQPDTELIESVCAETPREAFNIVGRTAEERVTEVPIDTLRRYVGVYELAQPGPFGIRSIDVSLDGHRLFVDYNGKGRAPLAPLSQTTFSPRLPGLFEFGINERGEVTHVDVHGVEQTLRAIRTN